MQFKALLVATLASVAVAQTATSSSSSSSTTACVAQNIVDSCVGTLQGILNSCSVNDYTCKCTQYTNMLNSCYAACPNDPMVGTVQSLKQQNCAAMSAYGTTTTLGTASATTASSATSTHSSSMSAVQSGFSSGSGSSTASSASATSSSHSGAQNVKAAGGLVALVAAGVAALC